MTPAKNTELVALLQRVEQWRTTTAASAKTEAPDPEFTDMGAVGLIKVYMRLRSNGLLLVRFAGTGAMAKTDTMLYRSTLLQLLPLFDALRLPRNITAPGFGHNITTQFQAAQPGTHEVPELQAEDQMDVTYHAETSVAWFRLR